MPTPLDTPALEQLLRQSDPAPQPPEPGHDASLTDISVRLAREVVENDRQTKGRRLGLLRRHKWASAAIAALVVVPTSAYAASHFLAQTGTFGNAAMTEEDASEWIDPCAADFPDFVRTLNPRSGHLPPRATWDDVAEHVIERRTKEYAPDCGPNGAGVREQTTGLRAAYVVAAQGLWGCELLRLDDASDSEGARAAANEVAGYLERENDLGVFGDDDWREIRDRLRAGDLAFAREYFFDADCA